MGSKWVIITPDIVILLIRNLWPQANKNTKLKSRSISGHHPQVISDHKEWGRPEIIFSSVLCCLSTRKFEIVSKELCGMIGIPPSRSTVSRIFKVVSESSLFTINNRSLAQHQFMAIFLDTVYFKEKALIAAMGINDRGEKMFLGFRQGKTENSSDVAALLNSFVERGLNKNKATLFVIDGSPALKKGIKDVFGDRAVIQRCTLHKKRNILDNIPVAEEELRNIFEKKWHSMLEAKHYDTAMNHYKKLKKWLEKEVSAKAAASLEEGGEELLTVTKLQIPKSCRKTFHSGNPLDSFIATARNNTHRVTNWGDRGNQQLERWICAYALVHERESFKVTLSTLHVQSMKNALRKVDEEVDQKEREEQKKMVAYFARWSDLGKAVGMDFNLDGLPWRPIIMDY